MKSRSGGLLGLAALVFCFLTSDPAFAQNAYITNHGDGTVSVIDTATDIVTATIPVGPDLFGVAVSPDGSTVYVSHDFESTVSVINTATNTVTATITVGTDPAGVAVSPNGRTAYVTNDFDNTVSVIDTATNTMTATIPVGAAPFGVAVSPDSRTVYVANVLANTVSEIDTTTNTVTATIPVGPNPLGVAVNPNGRTIYVANVLDNTVSEIDTVTDTVTATIPVGNTPRAFGIFIQQATPTVGTFTIKPILATETIKRGILGAFILQLKSVNGFNGSVALSCAGGPSGSKCADFPQTVHVNRTASTAAGILFPKNTAPGTYPITVTGISGSLTSTATEKFIVK